MPKREAIREALIEHGLAEYVEPILAATRPAIRITANRVADQSVIPIGASKIGGDPDLPEGFDWAIYTPPPPTLRNVNPPRPLTFIAQFRLSEVATLDVEQALPAEGLLYFFYEADGMPWGGQPNHREAFRVIYLPDEQTPLQRVAHPRFQGDFDECHGLNACQISFSMDDTFPSYWATLKALIGRSSDLGDKFGAVQDALHDPGIKHQLLGNPYEIQGYMELYCEKGRLNFNGQLSDEGVRAQVEQGGRDWRLLLQIDTDEEGHGVMWGDVGMIYFWIRQQDLAACRFEQAWCIMECS